MITATTKKTRPPSKSSRRTYFQSNVIFHQHSMSAIYRIFFPCTRRPKISLVGSCTCSDSLAIPALVFQRLDFNCFLQKIFAPLLPQVFIKFPSTNTNYIQHMPSSERPKQLFSAAARNRHAPVAHRSGNGVAPGIVRCFDSHGNAPTRATTTIRAQPAAVPDRPAAHQLALDLAQVELKIMYKFAFADPTQT